MGVAYIFVTILDGHFLSIYY